jgi:hypothetical protein
MEGLVALPRCLGQLALRLGQLRERIVEIMARMITLLHDLGQLAL